MNLRTMILMSITVLVAYSVTYGHAGGAKIPEGPWHLANNANYAAYEIDDIVVVVAYGQHHSAGYKVALRQRPEDIYPPRFNFVETKPDALSAQVMTPYATIGHFKLGVPVTRIRVFDADGMHDVPVTK